MWFANKYLSCNAVFPLRAFDMRATRRVKRHVGYNNLVSSKLEWNDRLTRNPKYLKLKRNKNKNTQKSMLAFTIFVKHGLMAHVP